jgi:hypothetical protein
MGYGIPRLIDLRQLEPLPTERTRDHKIARRDPGMAAGFCKARRVTAGALNRDGSYFAAPWRVDDFGLVQTDLWDRESQSFVKVRPLAGGAGLALVERYVNTITPASVGASVQPFFIDMPRDFIYGGLLLQYSGTVTVAGGVTNGTLDDEEPMEVIERIVFEGTGGGAALQLKNMRARHFFRAHQLLIGKEPQATPLASAGVQTASPSNFVVPVWFALPGNQVPPEIAVQSVLDPSEYGKLTLEVDFGLTTDYINGGDRVTTIPSGALDVYALQAVNVSITKNRPYRYIESFFLRDQLAAIQTERRLTNPIPVGRPIRYVLLVTRNEVTNARQPVDDTLGTIKLFISQTLVLRYGATASAMPPNRPLIERNRHENRVFDAVNPAGHNALSSRDNPVIGYLMMDFAKGGRLDGILDASRFPARGVPIDFLHDVLTAATRQLDVCLGFLVPGGAR